MEISKGAAIVPSLMSNDWIQVPINDRPVSLGSILAGSRLVAIESDVHQRRATLRFSLPPDAGPPQAEFVAERTTHFLAFVYLPPAVPISPELSPEQTMAAVGEWARQGLITTADPLTFETPLVVERASFYKTEGATTFSVEGYGEDADRLVWWEVRLSGETIEAV